jgi:hypothetical protein
LDYLVYHINEHRGLIPADRPGPLGDHDWNHLICTQGQFEEAGLGKLLARRSE